MKKDSEERDKKKKESKRSWGERKGKERMLTGRKERERKFITTCLR